MATTSRSISVLQGTLTLLLYVLVAYSIHCDGRGITGAFRGPRHLRSHLFKRAAAVNEVDLLEASNTEPYGIGSPFTLPPFDSLPPVPLPDSSPSPPFCINPPGTPQTPPSTVPSPAGYPPAVSPPLSPFYYIPPTIPGQSPPPSPPSYYFPAPPGAGLGPPVFLPPVIFPAPKAPPPPLNASPSIALWCVAKPSVPDPIIREAMNYACGSGADCASIQPDGLCFEPNTLFAHASYAFNSFWQRTKVAGGSCSFGGIAMLVTVDPSYDGCHFLYY